MSAAQLSAHCAVPRPFLRTAGAARRPAARRGLALRVRSEDGAAAPAVAVAPNASWSELDVVLDNYRRAPPSMVRAVVWMRCAVLLHHTVESERAYALPSSPPQCVRLQKYESSADVLTAVEQAAAAGILKKWGCVEAPARRNVLQGELRRVGMQNPEKIAVLSVRNDAAFLFSVVATTSVAAVVLGQLPGDWGGFSAYLCGCVEPRACLLLFCGCLCTATVMHPVFKH